MGLQSNQAERTGADERSSTATSSPSILCNDVLRATTSTPARKTVTRTATATAPKPRFSAAMKEEAARGRAEIAAQKAKAAAAKTASKPKAKKKERMSDVDKARGYFAT